MLLLCGARRHAAPAAPAAPAATLAATTTAPTVSAASAAPAASATHAPHEFLQERLLPCTLLLELRSQPAARCLGRVRLGAGTTR